MLQCSHVIKDVGVHQTKGQRAFSNCNVHNSFSSAEHRQSLGKGLSAMEPATEQKLLEEPTLLTWAQFSCPSHRAVPLGSSVLPEVCQEENREVSLA